MRHHFLHFQNTATCLSDVQNEVISVLSRIRQSSDAGRLGYAAGIITSDGPEHVGRNVERLAECAERLRRIHRFPVFAATDVFSNMLFDRLPETKLEHAAREAAFLMFWRAVLCSGHVTDIFMTPRWERSQGAQDEHAIAQDIGLRIHYVET